VVLGEIVRAVVVRGAYSSPHEMGRDRERDGIGITVTDDVHGGAH
jgi:hypothetical protein